MKWLSPITGLHGGILSLGYGTASGCFFARRFASSVSYYPPTSRSAHPIPKLPIIDSMVACASKLQLPSLEKTAFIGVQHILETTATLFKGLIDIGVKPENMFFAGKPYSTSHTVAEAIGDLGINLIPTIIPKIIGQYQASCYEGLDKMWQLFIYKLKSQDVERIIILDDGGRALETMPTFLRYDYAVAAIEQTRGGLYSSALTELPFPLIEVASSAVKRMVEPPLITEAILRRVHPIITALGVKKKTNNFRCSGKRYYRVSHC